MTNHGGKLLRTAIAAIAAASLTAPAHAAEKTLADVHNKVKTRVTQAQREAAAKRQAELRAKVRGTKRAPAARTRAGATVQGAASATSLGGFGGGFSTIAAWPDPSLVTTPGGTPDYFGSPNWAFSPPLRKFVDRVPGLGPTGANGLGQYLSIAKPDTTTYPGSDYYEIGLQEFEERMHSDLPNPTRLRGYVQLNQGTDASGNNTLVPDPPHYLGATIVAQKNRPVRIKFKNQLPTGAGGDLFIPVDTSIMGAGEGNKTAAGAPCDPVVADCAMYKQNRATLHLHGGRTPWISDGTPHQWTTPATESTPYPKGASVVNVPDMPPAGPGELTFFYSNQQSARLMFYHDHAYGITRLNVYQGEAAGYIIQDQEEKDLLDGDVIPTTMIALVIQDKTFVDASTVRLTDPTWNWGTGAKDPATGYLTPKTGDLWYPHVYSPAQNPYDLAGSNPFGRWHYGPWFWPPTNNITHLPVPNPYYDPENAPWEPPEMPATPNPSIPGESFMDTAMVNGTAFPYLEVKPKAYRLRILNAANDRFFNLQMYVADPDVVTSDGRLYTEVKMVPAVVTPGFPDYWPTDGREGGVPDPTKAGPPWIQIGTEGGFLPAPAVIVSQPVAWNNEPTTFNFGNVSDHSLLVAPAERADVIVDFSKYAGKTLILYNDAPAAFPASDPRLDYYTGAPDLTETGGHPGPQPGFGPNTRTVMQIRVAAEAPASAFDLAGLQAAFRSTPTQRGTFARSQDAIPVAQPTYNSAYNATFPNRWPYWGVARIQDWSLSFHTLDPDTSTSTSTSVVNLLAMKPKAIHDEMGAAFDMEYGRMSGKLGTSVPNVGANLQNFNLLNYIDPVTEVVSPGEVQIWKITHNGVDTHPIHFHLFDVQLLNRVGWDGQIRLPDANELGWKDTVRISPLEDTIVALRPVAPIQPFGVPDSVRLLSPSQPEGATAGFANIDPVTGQPLVIPTTNQLVNFGWEYVWHCHILTHEEDDMMRPISMYVPSTVPDAPTLVATPATTGFDLAWSDGTPGDLPTTWGNPENEVGFRVERADGAEGAFVLLAKALANQTTFHDGTASNVAPYRYRVIAFNAAGDSQSNVATVNEGLLNPPAIGWSPPSFSFGAQRVGVSTAAAQVVVSNGGPGALVVGPVTIAGPNPGDFGRTTACSILAVGSTCNIDVWFRPTATGPRAATLVIGSNDPAQPSVGVMLTGTGQAPVATVAPAALGFAPQRAGTSSPAQLVTIANTGTAPLVISELAITGTNFGEFAQTNTCGALPAVVAPGTSCTASVWFAPAGRGARSATLSIVHDASAAPSVVSLSGTGASPLMSVSPAALSFPAQRVNVTSAIRTVTVSNTGNAPLAIISIAITGPNAADFSRVTSCGASLPANSSCSVDVTFRPASAGVRTATLAVSGDDAGNPNLYVALDGTATAILFSGTSLAFGDQVNSVWSAGQTITMTNEGASPMPFTVTASGHTADFRYATGCGTSIPANASCGFAVYFRPTLAGPRSVSYAIAYADPSGPTTIVATGNGVAPIATSVPNTLVFKTPYLVPSASQAVTITNTGTFPLTIKSFEVSYTNKEQFQITGHTCPTTPATLAIGASCTVSARFLGGMDKAAAYLAVETVYPANAPRIYMQGFLIVPTYTLATSIPFPNTAAGSTSAPKNLFVKNTGTLPLAITGFTVSGTDASAFSVTDEAGCVGTLAAGAFCSVPVTFTPPTAGAKTAKVTVNVGFPAVAKSVPLTGTGL